MRLFMLLSIIWAGLTSVAAASNRLTLKNGMVFEGKFSDIAKLSENPLTRNSTPSGKPVVLVDDELRRTYFPKLQLAFPPVESGSDDTPIRIDQPVASANARVGMVGAILGATPFDDWGRRTVRVRSSKGTVEIVQGITEVSPVYCRVQGLRGEGAVDWDMRMATSSIPLNTLRAILLRNDRKTGSEAQRDVVRLLFQAERYTEAARELARLMADYPEVKDLEALNQQLIQQSAQRLLREIKHRKAAGQHRYASFLLQGFPTRVDATENLIQAKELLQEYEQLIQRRAHVLELLDPLVAKIVDAPRRKLVDQVHDEIKSDLNVNNMDRMADFLRFAEAKNIPDDAKLSIAMSGWLLGQGNAQQNLAVTSSLVDVRNLVREYMRAMGNDNRHIRKELADRIRDREGGTPENVAKLLGNMKPPHDLPAPTDTPGSFDVDAGLSEDFPVKYHIQLPPEYDPYRRYPMIVTLHGAGTKAKTQVEWWTGAHEPRPQDKPVPHRMGPSSRDGYIVLSPEWTSSRQKAYEYSAREHHVVLASVRDAMRRFSVDSDRVILSGHALGGDAAWDIGSSHPDMWAAMVLIGARADYGKTSPQYVTLYSKLNPQTLPMYFVFGELDSNKMADNSIPLNRYMSTPGFDSVVVQYQGRGNEHFYEEIQRVHQWMGPLKRNFFPERIEVHSLRPWDNYFWYVDLEDFPSASMISPLSWPPEGRTRACNTDCTLLNNRVTIRTGASFATVWLSPEMVSFDERIEVKVNGKEHREDIVPDLDTVLEDARSRADRQHIFWASVKLGTPRR